MSETLLRELATQIAREQLYLNWPIYLGMLGIAIVVAYGSSFLTSYTKKRAENFATKTDFEELLKQLKSTTETAEQVKVAIAHSDWSTRELKTLRRQKLEDLLQAIYETKEWQSVERDSRIFNSGKDTGNSPISRVELLSALYFPELFQELHEFGQDHRQMMITLIKTQKELREAKADLEATQKIYDALRDEWNKLDRSQLLNISIIEKKCRELMKESTGN